MTTVEIEYCEPCGLRGQAFETGEAILGEFGRDIDQLNIVPGHGGVFTVAVDGEVIFDKDEQGYDQSEILAAVAERTE